MYRNLVVPLDGSDAAEQVLPGAAELARVNAARMTPTTNYRRTKMIARDIMTSQPTVIARAEPIRRAAQLMAQMDVGALPVVDNYENRRLVGIITDRDIVIRHVAMGASRDCCVADHMTAHDVQVVHPDTNVRDVLGSMSRDQVRRIPVVDENDTVVGMIAQADIACHVGGRDPRIAGELLGEISTHHHLPMQAHV